MKTDDVNEITASVYKVAQALCKLGTNDAATSMGAVELLAKEVKEGTERIAIAIAQLADAIREHSCQQGDSPQKWSCEGC
jgi:hypothetical protein